MDNMAAYDDLVNAVIIKAYEDLVESIRAACKAIRNADNDKLKFSLTENDEWDRAILRVKDVEFLERWFREALPQWRDLDADKIIRRAYKESKDEPEAVFDDSAAMRRKIQESTGRRF